MEMINKISSRANFLGKTHLYLVGANMLEYVDDMTEFTYSDRA